MIIPDRERKLRKWKQPATQQGREEREQESATIRTSKVDPLRTNITCHEHISGPAKPQGPPRRSRTAM